MDEARNDQNDLIIGRNAVFEAIKSGREIDRLFVQRGEQNPAVKRLISMAREKGAVIKEVDSKKLDFMCGGGVHQGVALSAREPSPFEPFRTRTAPHQLKGHQSPQATRACPALFLYLFRFR